MPPAWVKHSRRLDDYLDHLDEATLKRLTKLTGGPVNARRSDWVAWITLALDQPERVRNAVNGLRPHERAILALLRELGGESEDTVLRAATFGAGVTFPGSQLIPKQLFHEALTHLVRAGLALNWNDTFHFTRLYPPDYYTASTNTLFSDDRILAQAGAVPFQAPELTPLAGEKLSGQARLPHLITMEVVALLHAIERAGGIGLTQAGALRAVDMRKIAKALNLPDGNLEDGGMAFPAAVTALVGALRHAGILQPAENAGRLVLVPGAGDFSAQPLPRVVRALLRGMIRAAWTETGETPRTNQTIYPSARAALYMLLCSLPAAERGPFYTVASLDEALFERISSFFSLSGTVYRPALTAFLAGPAAREGAAEFRLARRREWLKTERPWLEKALSSWLYFLGVVELVVENGRIEGFRLTDLGRAALHPELEAQAHAARPPSAGPAWVIQPNFDIIAYLDRLSTAQLAFLERHAERRSAQEHLAEYRLTRDSVYRGLESGTRADDLLAELARGAGREVPQNIAAEIREWAAQRERITLYRRATLAEFPSEMARELAMRAGLNGKPVGERYLLLTGGPNRPLTRIFKHTVNYDQAPPRNLIVTEDGRVTFHAPTPDLLLQARLKVWSEPHPEGGRVFTPASVAAAVAGGRSLASLLKLLDERQYRLLPPLVRICLRAWAGEKFAADLQPVTILRVGSTELAYAIQQSERLHPYLQATLSPGVFLVRADQVDELRALLKSLGFTDYADESKTGP